MSCSPSARPLSPSTTTSRVRAFFVRFFLGAILLIALFYFFLASSVLLCKRLLHRADMRKRRLLPPPAPLAPVVPRFLAGFLGIF
jgi:uncharacterized membrane protein YfcA